MSDPALVGIEGMGSGKNVRHQDGIWDLTEDDLLLIGMLADPVYCPELLFSDPANHDYAGCYRVRDHQYDLNRIEKEEGTPENNAVAACARSVGKTEAIKNKACSHPFRRHSENLLVTAPELIHLLPLTDAIEDRINTSSLLRTLLDKRNQKTGFTHRPFGVDFWDGTKIVGRIPRLTGTGVKGQHQPDLIIDEGQDYPERGWTEINETVMREHTDKEGNRDYTYHVYGVHSGARDTGFYRLVSRGYFLLVQVTKMMTPGWSQHEKELAKGQYGGSQSPDYRRNILGEPGAPATAFFVISRLMACVDQDRESDYNIQGYREQELRVEDVDEMTVPIPELLDLPSNIQAVTGGMDVGLTNSPTVISVFDHRKIKGEMRGVYIRRFTLHRFRTKQIRHTLYAIAAHCGSKLQTFGMDVTGLGFPIFQEMEDDEHAPAHLLEVARGYFFNSKVPVAVADDNVTEDHGGRLKDQYGAAVQIEEDPLTGVKRYVTYMAMIEASTRYMREDVDSGYYQFPFDPYVISDMQGETQQRVQTVAKLSGRSKPNALHILDSMRAEAMARRHGAVEEMLAEATLEPVLDLAL
jgi:hypothetical protein